jgi:two-component system response regulator AtoC
MSERGPRLFRFESPGMREVERLVAKVAPTSSTVLITGESGTGKGVVARSIHEHSERREAPFVSVNCSAIPEQLLESEFFGHTKGAFTGADHARKGLFVEAHRGTLFLDEIGELPLHMQSKLLNVLEDREVRPIGSEQSRRVDTRIIAATNRNLLERVRQGSFREDLYFRLSMFRIEIPPLRERGDDVPNLIRFLLGAQRTAASGHRPIRIDPLAEEILLSYRWPGNVRELDNAINRACILADDDCIMVGDLPSEIVNAASDSAARSAALGDDGGLRERVRRFERELLNNAIADAGGDRKLAAQRLGVGLSTLYRKLEDLR